jgi:hypothetical protein
MVTAPNGTTWLFFSGGEGYWSPGDATTSWPNRSSPATAKELGRARRLSFRHPVAACGCSTTRGIRSRARQVCCGLSKPSESDGERQVRT